MSRIRHPNLVGVHDCGFDEERKLYHLVMDYATGSSLRQMLAFEGRLGGKILMKAKTWRFRGIPKFAN